MFDEDNLSNGEEEEGGEKRNERERENEETR